MQDTVVVAPADNFISLAVVRSLGRNGLRVVAIVQREGIGGRSRYATDVIRAEPGVESLVAAVKTAIGQFRPAAIIGLGELEIIELNRHREQLEKETLLLFPDQEHFELVLRKDKTLQIARGLGIDIPQTVLISGREQLHLCSSLHYPVVVKPRQQDVVDFKSISIPSVKELTKFFQCQPTHDEFYLVQEFCPGSGLGVELLLHQGKTLMTFQHVRVREFPPEGGTSVCCKAVVPEPELVRKSEELLRAIDWEGVAMVEYRRDEKNGRTVLMEVNGRFWGSLPLAIHAGADFPYALFLASRNQPIPSRIPNSSVRARLLIADTKWLLSVLKSGSFPRVRAVLNYLHDFRPGVRSFAWSADDPGPALGLLGQRLHRLADRLTSRIRRAKAE